MDICVLGSALNSFSASLITSCLRQKFEIRQGVKTGDVRNFVWQAFRLWHRTLFHQKRYNVLFLLKGAFDFQSNPIILLAALVDSPG